MRVAKARRVSSSAAVGIGPEGAAPAGACGPGGAELCGAEVFLVSGVGSEVSHQFQRLPQPLHHLCCLFELK
jgi:hypothetical protein